MNDQPTTPPVRTKQDILDRLVPGETSYSEYLDLANQAFDVGLYWESYVMYSTLARALARLGKVSAAVNAAVLAAGAYSEHQRRATSN